VIEYVSGLIFDTMLEFFLPSFLPVASWERHSASQISAGWSVLFSWSVAL
jgi:hypothetical protein